MQSINKKVAGPIISSALILLISIAITFGGMSLLAKADTPQDPVKVASSSSSNVTYLYDESGERIMKNENGKKTYYVNKYYEEDSDGTTRKFVYANGIKVATITTHPDKSVTTAYHHPDHLGGSNVSTDSKGQVVEVNDYYPFGSSRIEERTNNYTNNKLFTGKELDKNTGLYYYGARYYDPSIGRFTSVDPWQDDLTNPQTLNKYSYVTNNPIKFVDPTGMYSEDVHYDLTYYLGLISGLQNEQAKNVAYHDQNTDDNWKTSPLNPFSTKKYHFATREDATKRIDDSLENKEDKSLKEFGTAMHTYQDTYSHKNLTRSEHIKLNAAGKNPDITELNSASIAKASRMARSTFFILRKLNLQINGSGDFTHDEYIKQSTAIWLKNKDEITKYLSSKDKKGTKIETSATITKKSEEKK